MTPKTDPVVEAVARAGEAHIAAELRSIASETGCGQRQMHLEIAAQIIEQGQFLHPSDFALSIELDDARREIAQLQAAIAALPKPEAPDGWDGVIQADRDFLAAVGLWDAYQRSRILSGEHDEDFGSLKAVAAFRLAHSAPPSQDIAEALKPFADCCAQIADDEDDEEWAKFRLLIKDYRRAAAFLRKLDGEGERP